MTASVATQPGWKRRFPALTYANYRLWLIARVAWTLGTGIRGMAQGFLIYELTHSAALLGYASFAYSLPILLLTLYGGVVADRVDRHRLVVVSQGLTMIPALLLAVLTATHLIQPWHIIVLALTGGLIYAFDNPARSAFVPSLVSHDDLANASMLDNTLFYTAVAVAPAIGGLIYAAAGPAWCFVSSVISFMVAVVSVARMRVRPVPLVARGAPLSELRAGLAYTSGQTTALVILFIVAMTTMFGSSMGTLLPAWAVTQLGGDARTNGLLGAAYGVGAVCSTLVIASLGRVDVKGKLLTMAMLGLPLALFCFAQTRTLAPSLLFLFAAGTTAVPIIVLSNILLLLLIPDALRGRVMSIFTLVNGGVQALGGLWIGTAAQAWGAPATLTLSAGLLLTSALGVVLLFPKLRALK